ncbi:MAG: DUF2784 domain-containing protein [Gammaproteobacteria bacterium]|nr:DUF2784 domain-containing protein [Gammaproteobacteria bacterium]
MSSRLAADLLLVLHASFIAFVVLGLVLIIVGGLLSWSWVRNRWFRIVHLVCIGIVVAQAWLGMICPLTTWEMDLRRAAGDPSYEGSFVAHWLSELIYYDAPWWVFIVAYTAFAMLVVISWFWVRPR